MSVRGHNCIQGVQGRPERLTFDPKHEGSTLTQVHLLVSIKLYFKNLSFCLCKMQLFIPSTSQGCCQELFAWQKCVKVNHVNEYQITTSYCREKSSEGGLADQS